MCIPISGLFDAFCFKNHNQNMDLCFHHIATLLYFICLTTRSDGTTMQDVKDLTGKLLDGYDKDILPIKNQSVYFEVEALIELRSISDLDEINEELRTVMLLFLFWKDESMVWNATEHANIYHLTMDAKRMWKPRLTVTNAHVSRHAHRGSDWDMIEYHYNGDARWISMKTFDTSCELDTTFYPFDIQRCSVELFIYGYYGSIKFNPFDFENTHLSAYEPQGTWNVTDYYVSNKNGSNVTITYHLQRNPQYMIVNFLVPILVLALLNPAVFLLPADSGERVGYSMTIMLALSVYMTLLGDYLPQNSDPIPLMTYTIMIWYLLSATSLFVLFVSAHLHNTSSRKPVPKFIRLFVKVVRTVFCWDCKCTGIEQAENNEAVGNCSGKDDISKTTEMGQSCARVRTIMELINCRKCGETHRQSDINGIGETEVDGAAANCLEEGNSKRKEICHNGVRNRTMNRLINCCYCRYTPKQREITWQEASKTLDIFFMVFIYVVKIVFASSFMYITVQRPELERIISKHLLKNIA